MQCDEILDRSNHHLNQHALAHFRPDLTRTILTLHIEENPTKPNAFDLTFVRNATGGLRLLIPAYLQSGGLEDFLNKAPEIVSSSLHPLIEGFREWIYRCHRQNEVNGRIIAGSRRSVERSLNLIRGQNPDIVIYNAKGAARPIGPYRNHATA